MTLQLPWSNTNEVALVTFEWLFSCVVPHHVIFQMTSCNAGKLAHCASVMLFARVGSFVHLQIAWLDCSIVALVALVWVFSSVFHNVPSQTGNLIGWKVALVALVRFLPSVNEEVFLQTTSLAEWLVALWTIVPLDPTVGLLVIPKAFTTCKCIGTLVARLSICHLYFLVTSSSWLFLPTTVGWDGMGMGYAVGTGVATALKVVQRHRPFLANPEGKAG